MKFGLDQLKKKTPNTAKQWGAMFAAISTGIGALGYLTAITLYIHIGAVSLILSIVVPFLFGENDENMDAKCDCDSGCICDRCCVRDEPDKA